MSLIALGMPNSILVFCDMGEMVGELREFHPTFDNFLCSRSVQVVLEAEVV